MMSLKEIRVALWTKSCSDLAAIEESLARVGCKVVRVDSLSELEKVCQRHEADILVVSCRSAREVLRWLNASTWNPRSAERIPVLTLASSLDVDLYLEAMQLGAFDCAGLPLDRKELARLITRAVDTAHAVAHV